MLYILSIFNNLFGIIYKYYIIFIYRESGPGGTSPSGPFPNIFIKISLVFHFDPQFFNKNYLIFHTVHEKFPDIYPDSNGARIRPGSDGEGKMPIPFI